MTKACTKCGEVKPLTEFHRDAGKRSGLQSWCKACQTEKDRRYREANREQVAARKRRWREANREREAERKRRWREANREQELERMRRWREANREQVLEQKRRYYEANREQIAERKRRYYQANREQITERQRRYREANRERIAERDRRYYQANPEAVAERNRRYRAAKLGASGAHTEAEWQMVLQLYGGRCAYCGGEATTRDHLVPLSRGGSDGIENIVPACGPCNDSKGARLLWEWPQRPVPPR